MRTYTILSAVLLFLAVGAGCNKKSASPPYYMNARIGNVQYNGEHCQAYFGRDSSGQADTFIVVGSNYTSGYPSSEIYPSIKLCLKDYNATTSSYAVGGNTSNTAYIITGPNAVKQAVKGTVAVSYTETSADNAFYLGTFSFTCADGTVVSNGVFRCGPMWGLE